MRNFFIDFPISTALVGSLTIGATFFFSPVSGILVDKLGLRRTTLVGGILTTAGMFLSAYHTNDPFDPQKVTILCLTYGLMFGTGAGKSLLTFEI
jgi:MFS transporter, MCT family, solute carrier family 16 (monocarboxylic acid transporters), member 10